MLFMNVEAKVPTRQILAARDEPGAQKVLSAKIWDLCVSLSGMFTNDELPLVKASHLGR